MPTVMCTKKLWEALGAPSPLRQASPDVSAPSQLGRWSAKALALPEGDFVIAINELTYLAIVFPLLPLPEILIGFSFAVGTLLGDLGYSDELCQAEAEPFLSGTVFAKNENRSLVGTLNDLCYHVDAALEDFGRADPETLAKIQLRLSEIPHATHESVFPSEAASLLFATAANA